MPLHNPWLRSGRSAVMVGLFLALGFGTVPAFAQIAPPRPGVDLPPGYFQRVAKDKNAFHFKRAWIQATRRVQRNRRLRDLGIPLGVLQAEQAAEFRVQGTRWVPVLAGKFANTGADPYNETDLQHQLFDGPNPTGTITDFYNEISYGYLTLTGTVFGAQGGGLFQVAHDDTYYEGDPGDNGLGNNGKTGEYLKELLDAADSWVDFSQFDNDGPDGIPNSGDDDGFVDLVAFIQPEKGGECGGTNNIWSHRWTYDGWWESPYSTNDAAAGGGTIQVNDYTIQPLLSCNGTSIIEIGVFCHEFGHGFGLPDLYDTDGSSSGIGTWGLMSSGAWGGDGTHPQTPAHMCAWCKEQLGWMDPVLLCEDQTGISLEAAEQTGDLIKVYPHGVADSEYFLIENRVQTGFDQYLPGSGLAIWHVDNDQGGNQDENHKLVDLEEADGLNDLDHKTNKGDAGDLFPGSTNNLLFDDDTNPNARDYAGDSTGFSAGNFSAGVNPRTFDATVAGCKAAVADAAVDDSPWGNNNGSLDGNERADLRLGLRYDFTPDVNGVSGVLTSLTPGVIVLRDSVWFGTVSSTAVNYGLSNYEIEATDSLTDGARVDFQLDLTGNGGYSSTTTFFLFAGRYVLLVEDDGAANNAGFFETAIAGAGYPYVHLDISTDGAPTPGMMQGAVAVVWYTGISWENTFTPAEQSLVEQCLDGGGRLFVTGQDIGYDLSGVGDAADQAFYADYLHAQFISDTSNDQTLTGDSGDPIGDGLSITLGGGDGADNSSYPSVIATETGASRVLRYSNPKVGGIRYEGGHKLVYFAFNFEAINASADRTTVMQRVLDWLAPDDPEPPTATLLAPRGGEVLPSCAPRLVTWTASDNVGVTGVDLYYSADGGTSYPSVIATGLANTGSYSWTESGLVGNAFRVKLVARDAAGLQAVAVSDSNFTLQPTDPPSAQVLSPNGGEQFPCGTDVPITWTMEDTCVGLDSTRVFVSLHGGSDWTYVTTVTAPDTTATWTAAPTPSDSVLVRVEVFNAGGLTGIDESDSLFSLESSTAVRLPQPGDRKRAALFQNHPNPMGSASTTLSFYLPKEAPVRLLIYDLSGRMVRVLKDSPLSAGYHETPWDGTDGTGRAMEQGIYFYVLETPSHREVRKLVKLR